MANTGQTLSLTLILVSSEQASPVTPDTALPALSPTEPLDNPAEALPDRLAALSGQAGWSCEREDCWFDVSVHQSHAHWHLFSSPGVIWCRVCQRHYVEFS